MAGVNAPRQTTDRGQELPSARLVSTVVAQDTDNPSNNYTLLVMQWGQFLDHDLTHTPINFGELSTLQHYLNGFIHILTLINFKIVSLYQSGPMKSITLINIFACKSCIGETIV